MSKSVNNTSKEKHNLTQEQLAQMMGLNVPTKTSTSKTKDNSLKKVITNRLNQVMRETLCSEFGEYFFEIGETIVQHKKKDGEVHTSKDGQVTQGGYRIGNPTIYICGFQTQETPYVIKNGQTIFFKDTIKK